MSKFTCVPSALSECPFFSATALSVGACWNHTRFFYAMLCLGLADSVFRNELGKTGRLRMCLLKLIYNVAHPSQLRLARVHFTDQRALMVAVGTTRNEALHAEL